jgi:hypothetical protein
LTGFQPPPIQRRSVFLDVKRAHYENSQQPAVGQDPRQELPRRAPPRPGLRDQQEEPTHEGAPGLSRSAGRYPVPRADPSFATAGPSVAPGIPFRPAATHDNRIAAKPHPGCGPAMLRFVRHSCSGSRHGTVDPATDLSRPPSIRPPIRPSSEQTQPNPASRRTVSAASWPPRWPGFAARRGFLPDGQRPLRLAQRYRSPSLRAPVGAAAFPLAARSPRHSVICPLRRAIPSDHTAGDTQDQRPCSRPRTGSPSALRRPPTG